MIYLVHKQSGSTLQLPEGLRKIRALGESFYNCTELEDWSAYLHEVIENEKKIPKVYGVTLDYENGPYVHRKYWKPFDPSDKFYKNEPCLHCGKEIQKYVKAVYCSTKCMGDEFSDRRARNKLAEMETLQTHPGSMETISGGE